MPRFVMFMYPMLSEEQIADVKLEDLEPMGRYNEELDKAGALLQVDGLQPQATRVSKRGVTDGPFSEAKELVGGYWIIQAKDAEEAVEWAKRVPQDERSFVEVRQIYELSDFSEDIADAAQLADAPPHQTTA